MLVVTEVFIAPPTRSDKKRKTGEGGCFVQREEERLKNKETKETEVQEKRC